MSDMSRPAHHARSLTHQAMLYSRIMWLHLSPKRNLLNETYKKHDANNAYIIEVSMDKHADMFNEWDPAPFKRRDLDTDLADYIEDCATDIPLKYNLHIRFFVPKSEHNTAREDRCRNGWAGYWAFRIHAMKKHRMKADQLAILHLMSGIVFVILSLFVQNLVENQTNLLIKVLPEGIMVGGWVLFWECFSSFFFRRRETNETIRQFKRLQIAGMAFLYRH